MVACMVSILIMIACMVNGCHRSNIADWELPLANKWTNDMGIYNTKFSCITYGETLTFKARFASCSFKLGDNVVKIICDQKFQICEQAVK